MLRRYQIIFLTLLSLFIGCMGEEGTRVEPKTIEHQMAIVDKGSFVPENDPSVMEYRKLLDGITLKVNENEQQIGDMVAKTRDLLNEKGFQSSLMEIMTGMNEVLYASSKQRSLKSILGAYCTFRAEGITHKESVAMLKGLNKTAPAS